MTRTNNEFTVGDRLILHLSYFSQYQDELVCFPEMTQHGISEKLGIARNQIAVELQRLIEKEEVDCDTKRVMRMKGRRKVYFLTPKGRRTANTLRKVDEIINDRSCDNCPHARHDDFTSYQKFNHKFLRR